MRLRLFFAAAALYLLAPVASPTSARADEKADKAAPGVVAVFGLSGPITEAPVAEDFPFGGATGESLKSLVERMNKAAADDEVKGVVILLGGASPGPAQIEELRRVIANIRAAGKSVHVHTDSLSMGSYTLASAADSVSVVPTGDVWINGLYGESLYLRGLLDRLGVTPDYLTCGEYKSAAEMFTRDGPSKEAEENRNWLMDSLFNSFVQMVAEGRGVEAAKVRQWIDRGLFSAEAAQQAGVIDSVQFRQDFTAELKKKYGEKVRFDKRYGKKKAMEIDLSSPIGLLKFYAELLGGPPSSRAPGKDAVAIVYVEGPIMPGQDDGSPLSLAGAVAYSTPIRKALDKAADDDSVKAVVLRVNSPGGSAVASEIILNATKRVKARKPLVVSMGDVAGSGGYYVACGADTIFADKTTITGSIGVVGGKLATQGMWDKFGVTWKGTKRGANSGMLRSGSTFTDEERARLQAWMDEIYEVFKGHVVAIRGAKLKKDIDELAGGRVYTGQQALELGLIDELGGLEEAVARAAEQAGLDKYEVRVLPKPKSFVELLLGEAARKDSDDSSLSLDTPAGGLASDLPLLRTLFEQLDEIEPGRAAAVRQALKQLVILRRETIGLTAPVIRLDL